jgi:predicted Zn-dependent protease
MRARIQARLGLVEEALATYRALLARYPGDRALREDYAELLVDAGSRTRPARWSTATSRRTRPPRACAACGPAST